MSDAITLARRIVLADNAARAMIDYERHADFSELRSVANDAREYLRTADDTPLRRAVSKAIADGSPEFTNRAA